LNFLGEILAWDDREGRVFEFGLNRPVSDLRRRWLTHHGRIEDIDKDLHPGESDAFIVNPDDTFGRNSKLDDADDVRGSECWVKFVAFDVLMVGGPDAKTVLSEVFSPDEPLPDAGSLIHLDGFERKRILYHLLEEQKNEIEIVETVVIRPNGECEKGEDYFSPSNPVKECGLPAYTLDSAKWTLNVSHPSLKEMDETRRSG
jgi:hypothetical protein